MTTRFDFATSAAPTEHAEVTLKAGDQIGIGKLELELVIRQRVAVSALEPVASAPLLGLSSGELEIASAMRTVEIPVYPAETESLPHETSFEMPTTFAPPAGEDTSTNLAADTTIIPGSMPAPPPGYAPMPSAGYPPGFLGYAPGYPMQPMGYPGQPMYPGQYPGYPPQGYPQQGYPAMPGYPMQQQMPYGGAYPAPAAQQAPAPAAESAEAAGPAIKLPPPESTGVKAPAPAPAPVAAAPDAAGAAPKTEEKPSNTAADIIKSYMQKRTR